MDLTYTPEEQAFRAEVRAFVAANLPRDIAQKVLHHRRLGKDDHVRWQKILSKQGWLGGPLAERVRRPGLDAGAAPHLRRGVRRCRQRPPDPVRRCNMVAPVIMAFGSAWQKEHYLPRILSQEDWWCQGYSEPGSGSDLASLKTRASARAIITS